MKNVLITGASGFIASHISQRVPDFVSIFTSSRKDLNRLNKNSHLISNLRNIEEIDKFILSNKIDVIIHCAGEANVDSVENNIVHGIDSNLLTTLNLVNLSKKYNIFFIFFSSNAVFDGLNPPYDEQSLTNPVNKYGVIKLACERMIVENLENFCVVRPILTYGPNINNSRHNPVTFILDKLNNKEPINMVNDVYENPVYIDQVVDLIWEIVNLNYKGLIHISGQTVLNRYELAMQVAEFFNLDSSLISECSSSFFKSLAPRPKNTSFKCDKLTTDFGIIPFTFLEGLKTMKKLYRSEDL